MNVNQKVLFAQPKDVDERAAVAEACVLDLNLRMPVLLDAMDNAVDAAYAALPERLYVIDAGGRISYRSGPGPWGFDVDGWKQAIAQQIGDSIAPG
jgi:type I thyroxine 5'-deiodinase